MWWWGNGRLIKIRVAKWPIRAAQRPALQCITSSSNGIVILENNFLKKYASMVFIFVTEHFYM